MSPRTPPPTPELQLPFDPMTVVRGILRHKLLLVACALVAASIGAAAGWAFGKRTYEASSLIQYRVLAGVTSEGPSSAPSLDSLLQQVEVRPSIETLREQLKLEISIEGLGAAVEAYIPDQSALLTFKATWKEPKAVARIANKLRDIFLERWCGMQVQAVEALAEQSRAKLQAAQTREGSFQKVIAELQERAAEERKGASGSTDIQLRYGRLKEMIEEDRSARANAIELAAREGEYTRAQRLRDQGLISDPDFQQIKSSVDKQRALTQDTARTARWKSELDSLRGQAAKAETATPAEAMLQQVVVQALTAEMERVALQDQVEAVQRALETARKRLAGFRALEASAERTAGGSAAPVSELLGIQAELLSVRTLYDTEAPEFSLVSEAIEPVMPAKSTRKLIAAGVAFGLMSLAFGLVVLGQLLSRRVRSGADVKLKAGTAPLAVLPREADFAEPGHEFEDGCRLLAKSLRAEVPARGATFLVSGPAGGEGVSSLVERLAGVLGAVQGPVLVIDVHGAASGRPGITAQLTKPVIDGVGLGTVLDEGLDSLVYAIRPTRLPGVFLLPSDQRPFPASALGERGFGALLAELAPKYEVIFLDAPPVLASAITVFLAEWCTVTVVVVRGGVTTKRDLARAFDRLDKTGAPRRVVVLNGADPAFNPT